MLTTKSKRKTRSDKFPLTLHRTGQFCKKINGKLHYFGTDKQRALQKYLERATALHTESTLKPIPPSDNISIKALCNLYLDHQQDNLPCHCMDSQDWGGHRNHQKTFFCSYHLASTVQAGAMPCYFGSCITANSCSSMAMPKYEGYIRCLTFQSFFCKFFTVNNL